MHIVVRLTSSLAIVAGLTAGCGAAPVTTTGTPPCAAAVTEPTAALPARSPLESAVLWTQTSAEYAALASQTYATATAAISAALESPGSASPEQWSDAPADLPPAIILDLDETVLDNAAYQAWLITTGQEFSDQTWGQWCREGIAAPIPGALDFVQAAERAGATVFFVTNRTSDCEDATRSNLTAIGFDLPEDVDTVLTKGERPEWRSDKGTRRQVIGASYRVVMLLGDNLGDFTDDYRGSVEARAAVASQAGELWGTRWFMLPNPQYGSWASALFGHDYSLPAEERDAATRSALRPWDGPRED
ncbi:MAG: hypothetical protein H6700_10205 [Myxococcales bacterium]|nr:hypothetical protein [Myxococcales bacterium]MCB9520722.1 hypothetical protein [Myxococcales bacterium]MCB9532126.1 hypothetical protein [Myxococcales bacterium]